MSCSVCTAVQRLLNQVPINNIIFFCVVRRLLGLGSNELAALPELVFNGLMSLE